MIPPIYYYHIVQSVYSLIIHSSYKTVRIFGATRIPVPGWLVGWLHLYSHYAVPLVGTSCSPAAYTYIYTALYTAFALQQSRAGFSQPLDFTASCYQGHQGPRTSRVSRIGTVTSSPHYYTTYSHYLPYQPTNPLTRLPTCPTTLSTRLLTSLTYQDYKKQLIDQTTHLVLCSISIHTYLLAYLLTYSTISTPNLQPHFAVT
ncbi:hypothetical protein GGR58DRAFT_78382 [Xylaria digitata]|nr:hypothetical protein GGR58DRAFT_78382 [Xylaria digitata]